MSWLLDSNKPGQLGPCRTILLVLQVFPKLIASVCYCKESSSNQRGDRVRVWEDDKHLGHISRVFLPPGLLSGEDVFMGVPSTGSCPGTSGLLGKQGRHPPSLHAGRQTLTFV